VTDSEHDPTRDRSAVIDDGFRGLARWCTRFVIVAVAAVVLGYIVKYTWVVLLPVLLALIVCTVLAPPTAFLRRHRWPDPLAAAVVLVAFIAVLVGVIAALTPSVAGQSGDIAAQASGGLQQIQTWLIEGPLAITDAQLSALIQAAQDRIQSSASSIGAGLFSTIGAATSALVNLVIILILSFLFIKDGYKFLPWLGLVAGERAGAHLTEVLGRSWDTLSGFIRAQSMVAMIDAVIIGTGLLIVGVPLAVPLAVITFFGAFVPIVGAFVSGAIALLVTLVTNDLKDALIVLAIIVAVQQLEGNVLSPWLQGRSMNLHPAVVLLAVAGGGTIFGITGAFLAVPVAATVTVTLRYLNEQIDRAVGPAAPPLDDKGSDKDAVEAAVEENRE